MAKVFKLSSEIDPQELLIGAVSEDVLIGGEGNDTLVGGSGDDTIDGGMGDDKLIGGSGNDIIKGGAGNDFIVAGSGDDYVELGSGDNIAVCGSGDDTVVYMLGEHVGKASANFIKGCSGFDTLVLDLSTILADADSVYANQYLNTINDVFYSEYRNSKPGGIFDLAAALSARGLTDFDGLQLKIIAVEGIDFKIAPQTTNVTAVGDEDTTITLTLQGNDFDGHINSYMLKSLPTNGTLYTDAALTNEAVIDTEYSAASEQLTLYFAPNLNWHGGTSLEFVAIDDDGLVDATAGVASIVANPVNDPAVISGTDVGSVTESTAPTVSGSLTITDVDAPEEEAFTPGSVTGTYGSLSIDAAGNWDYSLDNSHPKLAMLDNGDKLADVLTVYSADGTPQDITITIIGTGGTSKIVYYSNVGGDYEIFVVDVADINNPGTPVQVTHNAARDYDPQWSPDGSKLAYYSSLDGDYEIFVVDVADINNPGTPVQVTHNAARDYNPQWSPDGSKLAYHSNVDGDYEVFVVNVADINNPGPPVQVTHNTATDAHPQWSPDGSELAYYSSVDGDHEIFVVDVADINNLGIPVQVTHNTATDYGVQWSPDGSKLAYHSNVDGDYEIFVVNSDGTGAVQVTHNTATDADPQWSPDGSKLVYHSYVGGDPEIFVANADGTGVPIQVTANAAVDVGAQWSPDGSKLTYHSNVGGDYEVFVVDVADINNPGTPVQVTHNTARDLYPQWSPDDDSLINKFYLRSGDIDLTDTKVNLSGIEDIVLEDTNPQTVTLSVTEVLAISDTSELRISTNGAGDAVVTTDPWAADPDPVVIDDVDYHPFTSDGATLLVEEGIDTGGIILS